MDKITRIRMKNLRDTLESALKMCVRLDNGTDPDGQYHGEQAADKIEDIMMELGMALADDEDGSLVKSTG